MKLSIITPTLCRPSLEACCRSVDQQTYQDWEHIIWEDREGDIASVSSDKRRHIFCSGPHRNFGNTPRYLAWGHTTGEYVLYLDDDNVLARKDALSDIARALKLERPVWALFPITLYGSRFFNGDSPGVTRTDSANIVARRDVAQWPNRSEYAADGMFAEYLASKYPFARFPEVAPIITVPVQSEGKP